jgi:hypothetical protein
MNYIVISIFTKLGFYIYALYFDFWVNNGDTI